jgi:hypothetical protein
LDGLAFTSMGDDEGCWLERDFVKSEVLGLRYGVICYFCLAQRVLSRFLNPMELIEISATTD